MNIIYIQKSVDILMIKKSSPKVKLFLDYYYYYK